MTKELIRINKNSKLILAKSKKLINTANKILTESKKDSALKIKNTTELKPAGIITDDPNRVIELEDNIDAWIDKDTGLMWEVKTEKNISHEYVWSEYLVGEAWFPEKLTDDVKDAFSYVKKLNAQMYGGFNDWRVPTREELETILTKEERNKYVNLPLSQNNSNFYWSSTTDESRKHLAWNVYFNKSMGGENFKSDNRSVRCVRTGFGL